MLPYGFATVDELKLRLDITTAVHDALLQEILNSVSGAIEASAGRQLRRGHRLIEFFTGGDYLIRTKVFPIAAIHSIRESETRDFDTAANYEELTEGATDGFILDRDTTGREPGESGFIRRLGQKWLGSEDSPGLIRVEYTSGYKTTEEANSENSSVTFDSAAGIQDFGIRRTGDPVAGDPTDYSNQAFSYIDATAEDLNLYYTAPGGTIDEKMMAYRLNTENILVPNWSILTLTLDIYAKWIEGDPTINAALQAIGVVDPGASGMDVLGAAILDGIELGYGAIDNAAYTAVQIAVTSSTLLDPLTAQLAHNFLAFGLMQRTKAAVEESTHHAQVASIENATAGYKPSFTIEHRRTFIDRFGMPDDLRHAALIQGAHLWQSRRNPGKTAQSMRGVAIASGASYMQNPAHLLPEVVTIAQRYRQYR